MRAQYQNIIEARMKRADLTILEKGLPAMLEDQVEAVAELTSSILPVPEVVSQVPRIENHLGFYNTASSHFSNIGSKQISPEGIEAASKSSCLPGCAVS